MQLPNSIVRRSDPILVTGGTGFIGKRLLLALSDAGFTNLRCLARSTLPSRAMEEVAANAASKGSRIEIVSGNLLSPHDCNRAVKDVKVIYHLAAGRGEKSFPDAFMNSVVTTRNLLEASASVDLRRFVNVSSFSVYANMGPGASRLLDENSPTESNPQQRGDAYTFAKIKQDEIVQEYGAKFNIPYVIVRPGTVYGPGNEKIPGRIGLGTFGIFLHLGGSNPIPLTFVDNCADAIMLAGLTPGIDGEAFNIVDDEPPTSRQFLRLYKRNVKPFRSLYIPHLLSYALCSFWERYSRWSEGQLPPVYNRKTWHAYWKRTQYSNRKARERLFWTPKVPTTDGLNIFFESCQKRETNA